MLELSNKMVQRGRIMRKEKLRLHTTIQYSSPSNIKFWNLLVFSRPMADGVTVERTKFVQLITQISEWKELNHMARHSLLLESTSNSFTLNLVPSSSLWMLQLWNPYYSACMQRTTNRVSRFDSTIRSKINLFSKRSTVIRLISLRALDYFWIMVFVDGGGPILHV